MDEDEQVEAGGGWRLEVRAWMESEDDLQLKLKEVCASLPSSLSLSSLYDT